MIQLPAMYKQSRAFCGPTSLRMILHYYGIQKTEDEVAALVSATRESGTEPQNIVEAAQRLGFQAEYKKESSIEEIRS